MTIIEDTRNKLDKHLNVKEYCDRHEIELVRAKLDVGDYQLPDGRIAIDTKRNLSELATNLLNRSDRSRFWKEVRRAREQGGRIKAIKDVASWHSPYSTVSGRALMEEIYRCHISYGVEFLFCSRRSTGRRIVELLTEEEA